MVESRRPETPPSPGNAEILELLDLQRDLDATMTGLSHDQLTEFAAKLAKRLDLESSAGNAVRGHHY